MKYQKKEINKAVKLLLFTLIVCLKLFSQSNSNPITATKSSNNFLTNITLNNSYLRPGFSTQTNTFYAYVVENVTTTIVTPVKADNLASVKINGNLPTIPIDLNPGANTINIVVTAEDGSIRNYVLVVFRNIPSNADLYSMEVAGYPITPDFSTTNLDYNVQVPQNVTQVDITLRAFSATGSITFLGFTSYNGFVTATKTISGLSTTIPIKVTSSDGTSIKTYNLVVNRTPAPTLNSFSPTTAGTGNTITINGASLSGATSVTFGGTPAASFNVASPTQIVAKVGAGSSGNVSVITPLGNAVLNGFVFNSALPISFISFNSKRVNDTVELQWQVADASDTKEYEIQRSFDGINFSTIATINTTGSTTYNWKDFKPLNSNSYYRIKAISLSSSNSIYTTVIKNTLSEKTITLSVYPNPIVGKSCNLLIKGIRGEATINLTNRSGQIIFNKVMSIKDDKSIVNLLMPKSIPAGIYYLSIINNGKVVGSTQVAILNK